MEGTVGWGCREGLWVGDGWCVEKSYTDTKMNLGISDLHPSH